MNNNTFTLSDGHIRLRAPEPDDLELLFKIENDTALWPVSCNTAPYSRHQIAKYIKESSHDFYTDRQIRFIIADEQSSLPMGCIDLTDIDPYNGRAEVGIALLDEFRGRGVARSVLDLLCSYSAQILHLHQLFCHVPADNRESLNLFQNSGFEKSGRLRDWLAGKDNYADVVVLQKIL